MALYDFVVLRATQGETPLKYLGVINDGSQSQDYLAYTTDEALSPNAKFAVEYAHDDLVHIRSCRTNKYWVRSSTNGLWIVAKATKPVDEPTSWSCTLFRMDVDDDNKAIFFHVQSGSTIHLSKNDSDTKMFFSIDPDATTQAVSIALDYDSFVPLPKLVAFKADNGRFFTNFSIDGYPYFLSDDIGDPLVECEILTTNEGHIRIKMVNFPSGDAYWTRSDSAGTISWFPLRSDDQEQLFSVIKIEKNIIALRHLGNNKLCCRVDDYSGFKDLLMAASDGITREAQFEVVETVFTRTVKVIEFDLDNARIYNVTPIYSTTNTHNNPTDQEFQAEMDLTISTTQTSTWSNSISVTLGVTTTFETGIPIIAEGKIEVSAESSYEHQWEDSIADTQEVGDVTTVVVPPMKKAIAKGIASKGTCDIPFSYVQIDHLTTGETIKTTLQDGVFTGVNAYDFYVDVHYEDADPE